MIVELKKMTARFAYGSMYSTSTRKSICRFFFTVNLPIAIINIGTCHVNKNKRFKGYFRI